MTRTSRSISRFRFYSAVTFALCACASGGPACSSDSRHPSLLSVAGQPSAGGRAGASSAEAGSADPAGASGDDTGESGAGGDLGGAASGGSSAAYAGSGGKPPSVPAACDQLSRWSSAAPVTGITSTASEKLLALTPDELDLAFLRDGALYVAHRSKTSAAFESGSALTIPAGFSAAHGASLSADGRRLVLVSDPDQKQLGEWTRASREVAFSGPVDTNAFSVINQDSDFTGKIYASPIVSATDDQLFFNSSFEDRDSQIVVSTRTSTGTWSAPRTLSAGIFDGGAGQRRLPTGVSADGRTLFYFNEESGEEEARWRAANSVNSPLYEQLSLGARRGATPNSACNRLYFENNGDIVAETD